MNRGFSSPEKPATGSQRGVEKDGARERPGKEVHRKPENTRLPLASPETGLSQEPPDTLADDGIDLLWGAEGGQSRSGPRTEHCGTRSDQPPVNRNPVQEVRRRSLIVRYPGGFSAVTSRQPASHAIRTSVGSALPARVRVSGLDSDSSPHSMPRQVRVDACAAIPINVVETANASLDMTAAAVEAAPIGCPAQQVNRRAPQGFIDLMIGGSHCVSWFSSSQACTTILRAILCAKRICVGDIQFFQRRQ